jgi:MFS transporter, SP family, general alpha glucoside:H+ symporter
MISPDAGNLGVKAVYVWAGLLVPTVIILWLFYPEVCSCVYSILLTVLTCLQTYGRTYWELDELYERKIPAWKFKNTKTHVDEAGGKNKALMARRVSLTV